MVNWLELIEEKEDQILAEGEKAYNEKDRDRNQLHINGGK